MSKLNSLRIVNLNYNNNTMKINDQLFEFAGESTLMNLRNGGGKTVLVQMMMAPFVNKRHRDLKDRTFESYFNSQTPTYILTEWVLDGEASYVLIGMAVRKKISASDNEDSEEELEILNFIHEYKGENEYSIGNIPLVEDDDKNLKVKSFGNFKKLLEELKKSKDFNLNYFDMSVSSQSRNYFKTLKQYKINNKEWESIIRKINMEESGLSKLFSDTKTISGLVEKWFIKSVEDKLNKEENKINNFKDIMMKFIYQYKENESKLEKKSSIESFREEAKSILSCALDFSKDKGNRKSIENSIVNLVNYILASITTGEDHKKSIEEELESLKLELEDIKYEKYSSKYYNIYDKIEDLVKKLNMKNENKEEKNRNKEVLNREKGIFECAKIYEDYKYASLEVQKYENQLELINAKQKDTEKERINIGFTLKEHFMAQESYKKEVFNENIKNIALTQDEVLKIKDNLKKIEFKNRESQKKLGKVQEKVSAFHKVENKFNDKYHKNLVRNMLGYYSEESINTLKNSYEEEIASLKMQQDKSIRLQVEQKDKLPSVESEQFNIISNKEAAKSDIKGKKILKDNIQKEILRRQEILKYIDVKDEKLYDKEYLIDMFNEKLMLLKEDEKKIFKENIKLEEEINTLKTGRNLKLPVEVQTKLEQRGITILYGIDWLKKNSYSMDENLNFIEKNPFLPYSLIMEEEDIEKLNSESLGVFTSMPIPIISKRKLDNSMSKINDELCTLGDVTFYISFNNKLLNEEELKKLLLQKDNELKKYKESINFKRKDIDLYEKLKGEIENSQLKNGDYEAIVKDIEDSEIYLNKLEETHRKVKNDLEILKKSIEDLSLKINALEKGAEDKNREYEEYKYLIKEYEEYKLYKTQSEEIEQYIYDLEMQSKEQEALKNEKESLLNALNNEKRDIERSLENIQKELYKYLQYNEGIIIEKDIEDLQARYEAITSKISKELEEIEKELQRAREQFAKKQDDLIHTQREYNLAQQDFESVIYDRFRESEIKREIVKVENAIEEITNEINKLDKNKGIYEKEIENISKEILKDFGKECPKNREEILDGDFEGRIFNKNSQIKVLEKDFSKVQRDLDILNQNLSALDEYKDFEILEELTINIQIEDLGTYKGRLLRDYKEAKEKENEGRNNLSDEINRVTKIMIFNSDDFFKKSLDTLMEIIDDPDNVAETLEKLLEAHKMILEQLREDLQVIHKEKDNILEIIYEYVLEIHENLGKIDKSSTIKIKDKYVKMLLIELPDWESNKELYKIRVKDFIEGIVEKALILLNENKNIEDMVSSNITTVNLYNEVVSISNIDVKLYKIEEDRQVKISWNEVSKNSGGEGFLSAFVILSSLLSYMRRDESDILTTNNEGKVLVMDNPFAQTNAEHLLKPLMDIAKRSNTQLICFTGLGGESIYNRFDNIYVLDLKSSKLKNGTQKHLVSNHVKGEEAVSEIISSNFKIKEELVEQMELF